MENTIAIVMAGGTGERLQPLTRNRAKPAVPFGGKFRLIDFPLSNCINSGIRRIFVLTQYRSTSLNRHLQEGWNISSAGLGDYVYTMPAQQKRGSDWYRGTADAVRQNLDLVQSMDIRHIIILSGDHVYKMNYAQMLNYHRKQESSLTISVLSVSKEEAAGKLGVLEADRAGNVIGFEEKPSQPRTRPDEPDFAYASMGIYIFSVPALLQALQEAGQDFGGEVIPGMIQRGQKVTVYPYERENSISEYVLRVRRHKIEKALEKRAPDSAYWRDVGTIDSYYQASLELLGETPLFSLYTESWPFRTHQKPLPPSRCATGGQTRGSLVSDGCVVESASVTSSVLSPAVLVQKGAVVEDSVIFDNVLIGAGAKVRRAIIDKQVIIQPGASLGFDPEADRARGCTISPGGVVVVPKEAIIGAG